MNKSVEQLAKQAGFTSQAEANKFVKALRLYQAMEDEGIPFKENAARRENGPGFDLKKYEETYGEKKIAQAERFLQSLGEFRQQATVGKMRESLGPDFFDNLLTDKMNADLASAFEEFPLQFEPFMSELDEATDFFTHEINRVGALPDIDDLNQTGDIYQEMSPPSERQVTLDILKRGNRMHIELETRVNDRLDYFEDLSDELAKAANRRLNRVVFQDNLNSNPTVGDGNSLFDSTNHNNDHAGGNGNVVSLNYSELSQAEQLLAGQTDPDGNPIFLGDGFILVTGRDTPNRRKAFTLASAEENPDTANGEPNFFQDRITEVIDTPFLTDEWYLFVPPDVQETLMGRFFEGHRAPEIENLGQDPTGETDNLIWKIQQHAGFAWANWEGAVRGSDA